MASIQDIADAIAARVETVPSLARRVSAFGKDVVDPPWAIVVPAPGEFITYDATIGGGVSDMQFVVKVVVGAATDRASQEALMAYLATDGSESVRDAVNGNLGGLVAFATVTTARNFGEVAWAGAVFNGVEFPVEVSL